MVDGNILAGKCPGFASLTLFKGVAVGIDYKPVQVSGERIMSLDSGIELLEGEEIVFEGGTGVLTNQRLFAYRKPGFEVGAENVALLSDITEFKKVSGGQDSRVRQGLTLGGVGLLFTVLELSIGSNLPELLDILLFMVGALGIVLGAYLVLRSVLRIHPHTTVFFRIQNGDDVPVSFPGRDNPEAENLIRLYSRAKRGL